MQQRFDAAIARSGLYGLLARLYRAEVDATLLC